ncbi:MAG: fructosamine kinase family protein [Pseudomonadota bacterium]
MTLYEVIGERIGQATGKPFRVRHSFSRGGGCISEGQVLEDGARLYFLKLNTAERLPMFEAEADGLVELSRAQALRVPRPVVHGVAEGQSFLVLEYLNLEGTDQPERLGEGLVALHSHMGECHGLARDNYIGLNVQSNRPMADWVEFWNHNRMQPQLDAASRNGASCDLLDRGEALMTVLPAFFTDYRPRPSLLHGDLWGGNYGYAIREDGGGDPAIFDPAVYYGDRETDIAMTELFGGFPRRFRQAYEAVWPLDPGYAVRRQLYNLYHVLNHFNLFCGRSPSMGGAHGARPDSHHANRCGYAEQADRIMQRLLSEVRG